MPRLAVTVRCCLLAAPLLLAGSSVHAQRPGAAVVELPAHAADIGVFAQYARGAGLPALGSTTSLGGTIELRLGRVTFSAGAAALDADSATSGWSVGAAVAPELCAPLRPAYIDGRFHFCELFPNQLAVRLRGGAAYSTLDTGAGTRAKIVDASAGAAVALLLPVPVLTLELWTAPRLHVRAASALASGGTERTVHIGPGWALGLAVTSASGLGASITVDELLIARPPHDGLKSNFSFGAGLHFVH